MLNNRRVWVPLAIVICLLSITAVWLISTAQGAAPTGVVSNYITALQHKDFRKIIDLTSTYKMEIARIKSQNPQALWPKLLEDYYKDKTTVLSSDPGFWVNYSGSVMGDPAQNIRALSGLLPPDCKWRISESRNQVVTSFLDGRQHSQTVVYVEVAYPTLDTSPRVATGTQHWFLKNTILEFKVDSAGGLVTEVATVPKADTFWTKPYPQSAIPFLQGYYRTALFQAQSPDVARGTIRELNDLSWDRAEPVLREAVEKRSKFFIEAVPSLGEHRDEQAVPAIVAVLGDQFKGTQLYGCDEGTLPLISALGAIGKVGQTNAVQVVKAGLSETITYIVKNNMPWAQEQTHSCLTSYLATLSALDDPAWRVFPLKPNVISISDEFSEVLRDFERRQQSSSVVDWQSPSVDNVRRYLGLFKPCGTNSSWRCPLDHQLEYVTVASASEAKMYGWIVNPYTGDTHVKRFEITVHVGNDPAKPWLITNAETP